MTDRPWRILLPFLVTRTGLVLAGLLATHLLVSGLQFQKGNLVHHEAGPALLEIWARWDAEWYLLIAEEGYAADEHYLNLPVSYRPGDTTGFFPLYPLAIRAVASVGPSYLLAGVLVSNMALLAALWFLRDLVRRDFGEATAERVLWIFLAFPTSLFLSAVYAESLMICCALAALWLARRDRPWLAGVAAALCTLSRPIGFLIVIALFDELAIRGTLGVARRRWRLITARAAAILVPSAAALCGYMLYCKALTGSLVPFLSRQERWRGPTSGPWRAFLRYLESPQVHDAHHSTIDLVVAVLLVSSIPFLFRTLRRSYALYATAAILLPLGSSLWSFSRFAAAIFPLHIMLGAVSARSERWFVAYMAIALPLGGLLMALYAGWWWVG